MRKIQKFIRVTTLGVLAALSLVFGGSSVLAASTVTGVEIQEIAWPVAKGGMVQLIAKVTGTGDPDQTVTWSLDGSYVASTKIDPTTGVLSIGTAESATLVTVKAVSKADPTIIDTYDIDVLAVDAVQSIFINLGQGEPEAKDIKINKSGEKQFGISVAGSSAGGGGSGYSGAPGDGVVWSVADASSSKTLISQLGKLTVGADETACSIQVMAQYGLLKATLPVAIDGNVCAAPADESTETKPPQAGGAADVLPELALFGVMVAVISGLVLVRKSHRS